MTYGNFFYMLPGLLLRLVPIALIIIAALMPKKKGYEYTSLDKKGVITNIVLAVLYVPLSIMGMFTIFFADAPMDNYSALKKALLYAVCYLGLTVPGLSAGSIFISIILRKRGHSKTSFIIQFVPLALFLILLGLVFAMAAAPGL